VINLNNELIECSRELGTIVGSIEGMISHFQMEAHLVENQEVEAESLEKSHSFN